MIESVLYLQKTNRSTLLVSTQGKTIINKTIDNIINEECIKNLSSLSARLNAVKQNYNIKTHIPIYVSLNAIMFPIYAKKHWTQIYINYCNIKQINNLNTKTEIIFKNNLSQTFEIEYDKMLKYAENCLKIYQNQNIKIKEEIYHG